MASTDVALGTKHAASHLIGFKLKSKALYRALPPLQWRQLESVAAVQQLCSDRREGWFLRLVMAPLVQHVIIMDVGEALRGLPASFFTFTGELCVAQGAVPSWAQKNGMNG